MPLPAKIASLFRSLFYKARLDSELDAELRSYLDLLTEEKIKAGLSPEQARRQAWIELGGMEQVKMKVREVRFGTTLETVWQDVRYGLRMLRKNPGFTAVAVLTLALGIGANTAIFSVVNAVLLRPLPFHDPDRLVLIWNEYKGSPSSNSVPDYFDRRRQSETLEEIAAVNLVDFNLTGYGEPDRIPGSLVTASFFPLMGVDPDIGRVFAPEEDQPDQNRVVVLSHGAWQRRFGGDPQIVGRTIQLNGQAHTVIGVMPASFRLPLTDIEVWKPIAFASPQMSDDNRGHEYLDVVGRIRSGYTLEQVEAEMDTIAARVIETVPSRRNYLINAQWSAAVVPFHEQFVGDVRPALLVLLGGVGLVLLIACANVANLLLARGAFRRNEIAIRQSLGASPARIVRQLLAESLLLAALGGLGGLIIAHLGLRVLLVLSPANIPLLHTTAIDGWVLGFSALLALITGVVFGSVPALQAARVPLLGSLKQGGRGGNGSGPHRTRSVLLVAETALTLMLLVGAGLLLRSFQSLVKDNPGFQTSDRLTFSITLPTSVYPEPYQRQALIREFLQRVAALPGVKAAGASHLLPFGGRNDTSTFHVENHLLAPGESPPGAAYRIITPGYLRSIGIPILQGRTFEESDTDEAALRVVVNKELARRRWPDQDPIGRRLSFGPEGPWREVIGVIGTVRNVGLDAQVDEQIYTPYTRFTPSTMSFVIHLEAAAVDLTRAIRSTLQALDPALPIYDIKSMDQRVGESVAPQQYSMLLLLLFAMVGLVLAGVGVYGVTAYAVSRRTHEIGIRMALGAQPRDILKLVVGQGMVLTLVGVGIGLMGAFVLTRFLESLLFGVTPTDPATFAAVSLLLVGVALLACYLPAHRATKVDPMVALRYE